MLFNTLEYLLFLPVCLGIFFLVRPAWRWVFLLVASLFFYLSFTPSTLILLVSSILTSWYGALRVSQAKQPASARRWLLFPVIFNLGLLFFFKYYAFTALSVASLFGSLGLVLDFPAMRWLLPIGISFYTFQIVSYLLDVYWGKLEPEPNLARFALFVAFFPKLVTGPIERGAHLLPQLRLPLQFSNQGFREGLTLILLGFFQKILIADNLALLVDPVFNQVDSQGSLVLVVAAFGFAVQMFCDFSGYTDLAIGSALLFGVRLSPNFNRPFSATSITDFWRRWHLTLSSWANDYLYKPLAFQKRSWGNWGVVYAVTATFLFLGIWHGARFSFILFGLFMGLAFYLELQSQTWRKKFWLLFPAWFGAKASVFLTFLFFAFCSIFFRANTTMDGFRFIGRMFSFRDGAWPEAGLTPVHGLVVAVAFGLFMGGLSLWERYGGFRNWLITKPMAFRWTLYLLMTLAILFFGEFNEKKFIYVEF